MTTGRLRSPRPVAYLYFAMWLTIGSMHTVMKLMDAISATGRMPVTAAPKAAPRIPVSAIGPVRFRSSPNSSFTASTYDTWRLATALALEIDVLHGVLRIGLGAVLHELARGLGLGLRARGDRVGHLLRERAVGDELGARSPDRILGHPLGHLFVAAPLAALIRDRAAAHDQSDRLDERRALAGARALDRLGRRLRDRDDVGAVDGHAGDAVALRAVRQLLELRLAGERHVPGVLVVLDDVHHRQIPERRDAEALVERAGGRRAVAEDAGRDLALLFHLAGERDTARDGDVRADDPGPAEEPDVEQRHVLPPAHAAHVAGALVEDLGQHLVH